MTALRVREGMTQEKLAAMSGVNIRTIQRAEKGGSVQLDTVASLAAALKVTVAELSVGEGTESDGRGDEADVTTRDRNAVVLRRMTSGKALLDIICNSFSGNVDCEAEPTTENVEVLTTLIEQIEPLVPKPWHTPMEEVSLSLVDRLRTAVGLTAKIAALEEFGVAVFAGTYMAVARVPRYDPDENVMYTKAGFPLEPVTICRVLLAEGTQDRVVIKVTDKWTEPSSTTPDAPDDIPF